MQLQYIQVGNHDQESRKSESAEMTYIWGWCPPIPKVSVLCFVLFLYCFLGWITQRGPSDSDFNQKEIRAYRLVYSYVTTEAKILGLSYTEFWFFQLIFPSDRKRQHLPFIFSSNCHQIKKFCIFIKWREKLISQLRVGLGICFPMFASGENNPYLLVISLPLLEMESIGPSSPFLKPSELPTQLSNHSSLLGQLLLDGLGEWKHC